MTRRWSWRLPAPAARAPAAAPAAPAAAAPAAAAPARTTRTERHHRSAQHRAKVPPPWPSTRSYEGRPATAVATSSSLLRRVNDRRDDTVMAPPAVDPAVLAVRDYLIAHGSPAEPGTGGPLYVDVDLIGLPGATETWRGAGDAEAVLPVRLYTGTVIVGPHFRGAGRPCVICLQRRFVSVRSREERGAIDDGLDAYVAGVDPQLSPFALEAIRQLVEAASTPRRTGPVADVYELSLADLTVTRHELVADSECPSCSAPRPDTPDLAVVRLGERPKPAPTAYRLRSAGRARPSRLRVRQPDLRHRHRFAAPGVPVHRHRPGQRLLPGAQPLRLPRDVVERSGAEPVAQRAVRAARRAGAVRRAVPASAGRRNLRQLPRTSRPTRWTRAPAGSTPRSSTPATPTTTRRSTPTPRCTGSGAHSLRDDKPVLVPEQLVFYLDRRPYKKFVQECSNGCASGSCVEEAVLHGMLELHRARRVPAQLVRRRPAARDRHHDLRATRESSSCGTGSPGSGTACGCSTCGPTCRCPRSMAVAERPDGEPGTLCFARRRGRSTRRTRCFSAMSETASYVPGFDERVDRAAAATCERWSTTTTSCTSSPTTPCCTACRRWRRARDFLLRPAGEALGRASCTPAGSPSGPRRSTCPTTCAS